MGTYRAFAALLFIALRNEATFDERQYNVEHSTLSTIRQEASEHKAGNIGGAFLFATVPVITL
jgi:hypothetical protein